MKKSYFHAAPFWLLIFTIQFFCAGQLFGQQIHAASEMPPACHLETETIKLNSNTPPTWGVVESSSPAVAAPSIDVVFDQQEGSSLLYQKIAAWTGSESGKAQVSLLIWVKNKQGANISWNKVDYVYVQNGTTYTKTFNFSMDPIAPNAWQGWQNSRDYHQVGDVLYLNAPIPTSLTVKLYFSGYSTPVVFTKTLAPYNQAFGMPFRAFDLKNNEVWESASTHGGGNQVFAYDMGVQGLENGVWTFNLPNTDGTENVHMRVWGKPVYAMADGVVKEFVNIVPNNPKPGQKADFSPYTNGGAGNHFYIQHGENIALYAHMQKGSLNPALMQVGAVVHAGDFLGLAGNSGNSDGPHLHVHIRKETSVETGPFRPLMFNTGFTIAKTSFTSLNSNADWTALTAHGLPGYASTRAFVWPSSIKPYYGTNVYNGVFQAGTDAHAMWAGATAAEIIDKDNTFKNSGLRMTDLSVTKVGNNLEYSAVWRAGSGVSKVQTGTTWDAFTAEWNTLSNQGYRLLDLEVFTDANGNLKYAGVYGAGNWGHYLIAGLSQSAFNAKWNEYGAQGYRLVDIEVYKSGGATLYAGVFKAGSGNYALWHAGNWSSFTTKWNELSAQGYRLVDLDTDGTGANTIYSGSFLAGSGGYSLYESNWNAFYSYWDHVSKQGLRLVDFNVRAATGPGVNDVAEDRENDDLLLVGPDAPNHFEQSAGTVEIKIFPNPASDQFTLNADAEIQSWMLINAMGSVVMRGDGDALAQDGVIRVNALPIGLYRLAVNTSKGRTIQQVEVMR
ncbi:MAG: peptidoglycan DD-metalloendopeptidase family protein [Bacteroidota bacterium]